MVNYDWDEEMLVELDFVEGNFDIADHGSLVEVEVFAYNLESEDDDFDQRFP